MPDIYQTAQEFKERLLKGERAAAGELLRAYGLAVQRIEARVSRLTSEIEAAKFQGEIISSGWLFERDRLTNLKREIEVEIGRFARVAELRVTQEQRAARTLGNESARVLVGEATGDAVSVRLGTLNQAAVVEQAGFASDGSPLRELFAERGPQVSRAVADELVAGVAEGQGARVIARRIRAHTGGELARALTISRTETLRAYREATRANYLAHSDVLRGWVWTATLTSRTCALCWAMHGRVFPLTARLNSHANCRCVMSPLTKDAEPPPSGVESFAKQEPGFQKSVLGPAKFAAFKQGKLTLADVVGVRRSERWGASRFEKPLSAILSQE